MTHFEREETIYRVSLAAEGALASRAHD